MALFLVLAVGAYVLIAVTSTPAVTVENPDHELVEGDEFAVDGRTYAVRSLAAEEDGDGHGHGGGGGVVYSGTLAWTNGVGPATRSPGRPATRWRSRRSTFSARG